MIIDRMAHRCVTVQIQSDLMATLTYFTTSPQAAGLHQSPSKVTLKKVLQSES